METPNPYTTDINGEECAFVAPYLTLFRLGAGQRRYDVRCVFNALRWMVRTGAHWRLISDDFPPWALVYQQIQRWIQASCFEAMVHDLRCLLRLLRAALPTRQQPSWTARPCNPRQPAAPGQATMARLQSPFSRRYAGPSAGVACQTGQCPGSGSGRPTG